jgi:hypothetical protein
MSTFKARRLYFQNIAHNNALIADGQPDVVDDHLRHSFFRINGGIEISADVLNLADFPCCLMMDMVVYPTQQSKFVYRRTIENELWFLSRFDHQGGVANELEDALDEAYAAATQFLAAMLNDYENNRICCRFNLSNSKLEMVGPALDNLIGWKLTFTDTECGSEFAYDSSDTLCQNQTEIIYFEDLEAVPFEWTEERLMKFGDFPIIEVWYNDDEGGAVIAWPTINTDMPAPDQTMFTVHNGAPKTGFIILK